jgi:hypothetical protein
MARATPGTSYSHRQGEGVEEGGACGISWDLAHRWREEGVRGSVALWDLRRRQVKLSTPSRPITTCFIKWLLLCTRHSAKSSALGPGFGL